MVYSEIRSGLIVTAKQTYYPIELSNSELLAHYENIQEYHQDISEYVISQLSRYKPDPKLIDQQPEMNPFQTRNNIISFIYELSIMTRVTDGVFFQSARLYDRYCSKRVVLKDQAKFVSATCLWLAAKTWGGCNHIINNICVPTGGRFYGPNKRARIPRLSELVHYCGGSDAFDESMFIQMERHILNTLDWAVYEPMINDLVLNVDENCLIQYELYKRQLGNRKEWSEKRQSKSSQDSDATVDDSMNTQDDDEDLGLEMKIQLINIKRYLIDLSTWQYDLLKYEMFELSDGIFSVIKQLTNQDQGPLLLTPTSNKENQAEILKIMMNAVVNTPRPLFEIYKDQVGVSEFIESARSYHISLQKKIQIAEAIEFNKRNTNVNSCYVEQTSFSMNSQTSTPMRNTSAISETSIFSNNAMDQSSPLTPQMYGYSQFMNDSACVSNISLNSISQAQRKPYGNFNGYEDAVTVNQTLVINNNSKSNVDINKEADKENIVIHPQQALPKSRIGNGMFSSPHNTLNSRNSSSRSSLASIALENLGNVH